MSRWWRAYDEAVDDPKLILLSDKMHRAWFNLMCIASTYGGTLPDISVIAVKLRTSPTKAMGIITILRAAGLVDEVDGRLQPHNWNGRQYKSDVTDPTAPERMRRYRNRHRNETVTVTPPRVQNTETERIPELRSGADAPPDLRADLFGRGLKSLANITGKTPDSCRSLVGKWLKSVNDEAVHVLGAIDDAARNRVADPVAWINRALNSHGGSNGKRSGSLAAAGADLIARAESFERKTDLVGIVEPQPGGTIGHATRR